MICKGRNNLINQVIEQLRHHLYNESVTQQLTSDHILKLSKELNRYINFYTRVTKNYLNKDYSRTYVHSNCIINILEVSKNEKFNLDSIIEQYPVEVKKWNQIGSIQRLLHYIETHYGWDAVEYMGEQVPNICIFPESVDTFYKSIQNLNCIFYQNHKSIVYIGEYLPYISNKDVQLFCHTPHYSTAFNHGLLKGLSKKFSHPLRLNVQDKEYGGQFTMNI
ncbi:aspartyl-phosphate phosphatase Spo0E family protein [Bacillus sp. BGMRC 2118]|nr:aspartyl-phosphate phosphatase Spo0E family protein [Bacillus sp. BGMRC 2118]